MTVIPPDEWPAIRARHDGGESYKATAEDYGVSHTTIHNVVTQYAA